MTSFDSEFDVVIVGSGGGGMVAALAAHDAGARAVVLEKQSLIGGSTCMSGGIVWVPNHPQMKGDSYEDAMAHFLLVDLGGFIFYDTVREVEKQVAEPGRAAQMTAGGYTFG